LKSSRQGSKSVSVVASLGPSPLGHSAFLVDTEETPEKTERGPDAPAYGANGYIQVEYSSD
jgi:hypothetical protein